MKKILAMTAALLAATPALAVERPYIGVSYLAPTVETDTGLEFSLQDVQLRAGSLLTERLGLEAQVGISVGDDEDAGVRTELQDFFTLTGVYRMPMGARGGLYVYAGYTWANFRFQGVVPPTAAFTEEEDGVTYGVGVDFPVFRGLNLELDYKSIIDEDDYSVPAFSVGLRKFL